MIEDVDEVEVKNLGLTMAERVRSKPTKIHLSIKF